MNGASSTDPVIIIGAGPAGLAAGESLSKRQIDYVVLESGASVAAALRLVDPEMRLLSPVGFSRLPDMETEPGTPQYLPFEQLVTELERYQKKHGIRVTTDAKVISVKRNSKGFNVCYQTPDGTQHFIQGSNVINATGIISHPQLPKNFTDVSCSIRWLHSINSRAQHLADARRLLVVGGGASAAEVLERWLEVRGPTDHASLSVRSRLCAVPHWICGIDIHYFVWLPEQLPCCLLGWRAGRLREPMTGRTVVRAIRKGLINRVPAVSRYERETVILGNGKRLQPDLIVFATGFRYETEHLDGLFDVDPDGQPLMRNCESTRVPGLFLLGFRFGRTFASPYLRGIARDAEYVAERIVAGRR